MIYKTLACTAALSFALSTTGFATDKNANTRTDVKTEAPKAESKTLGLGAIIAIGAVNGEKDVDSPDVKAMGSGSGAGKANFQDLQVVKAPSGGEDRLTENVAAIKIDGVEGEAQDNAMGRGGSGKVQLTDLHVMEAPACVTEDGAPDVDCNGVADAKTPESTKYERPVRGRPEPRQQRR